MKLLYCLSCHDVQRLVHTKWRKCDCGKSGGQYNDDLITATVGGNCRVFGIANPFFSDLFFYLKDEGRNWYRKEVLKYGETDCWYGETPGDKQIFRIESPNGPKLKCKISWVDKEHSKTTIVDKRDYKIDGEKPKFVICENAFDPSFKAKKKVNKRKK